MKQIRYFSHEEFLFLLWKGIAFRTLSQEDVSDMTRSILNKEVEERQMGLPDFEMMVSFDDFEIEVIIREESNEKHLENIRYLFLEDI